MLNLEQQITNWRSMMQAAGIESPVPLAELESHLRDEIASLVQSGVPEEKAFELAAASLGDSKTLQKEFFRSGHHWLWGFRNNPLPLKIIAASFVLAGLDPLFTAARVSIQSLLSGQGFSFGVMFLFVVVFWGWQVPLGLGLLRRSNAWRRITIAWSSFILLMVVSSSIWAAFHHQSSLIQSNHPETDFLLGVEVPFMLKFSLYLAHLAIMASSIYILTRPPIRALFRGDSANLKTAN